MGWWRLCALRGGRSYLCLCVLNAPVESLNIMYSSLDYIGCEPIIENHNRINKTDVIKAGAKKCQSLSKQTLKMPKFM